MDTKDYVGKFVKTTDGLYGMIDDEFGDRLGFVHAEKDSWTNELVDVIKVNVVSPTTDDGAKAFRSAHEYFTKERESLCWRIDKKLPIDDPVRLKALLTHCEMWLRKLDA